MTSRCQAALQRRRARGHVLGTHRLAVADDAGRAAFAEIDDEAGAAVLLPLDIADMDGVRCHSPEANEEGRIPHVYEKSFCGHDRKEPVLDLATQVRGAAHVTASPWQQRDDDSAGDPCLQSGAEASYAYSPGTALRALDVRKTPMGSSG